MPHIRHMMSWTVSHKELMILMTNYQRHFIKTYKNIRTHHKNTWKHMKTMTVQCHIVHPTGWFSGLGPRSVWFSETGFPKRFSACQARQVGTWFYPQLQPSATLQVSGSSLCSSNPEALATAQRGKSWKGIGKKKPWEAESETSFFKDRLSNVEYTVWCDSSNVAPEVQCKHVPPHSRRLLTRSVQPPTAAHKF